MSKQLPEWVQKHNKKNIEIKRSGHNYYVYRVSSFWDAKKKRAKKVSGEYLGKITKDGILPPKHKRELNLESTKEYGNIYFINELTKDLTSKLKEIFPYDYQTILCAAILKLSSQLRIKNLSLGYQTSYLSELFSEAKISPNKISDLLKNLGNNTQKINRFFDLLKCEGDVLAIDLTSIFTDSEKISFAEKGHNSKKIYHDQLQFLMIYSLQNSLPTFFKVLPGSIRDVSSLVNAIEESECKDAILVSDRGFTSENNWDFLEDKKLKYIFPLRRNSSLLSYEPEKQTQYFSYRKRNIWYRELNHEGHRILQYLDKRLMVEEEDTVLGLVEKGIESRENYLKKKNQYGIISIKTNTSLSPEKIYCLYKERNDIEVTFDTMKNTLDDDKTYMQSTEAVKGYFFITFIALYIHSVIQNLLIEKGIMKKYSVGDVLYNLSKIYKTRTSSGEILSEIPKQVRTLMEKLDIHIT